MRTQEERRRANLASQLHLSRNDPRLKPLIRMHGHCTLGVKRRDPFHVLATSIVSQQLSVKAADTIQGRIEALAGTRGRLRPQDLLGLSAESLRGAGLSNAKARWLHAISEAVESGEFSFARLRALDDEAAIEALDALPGIGRWTAEMFLMFALNRRDIFSMGDVGLRRGVNLLYNKGAKLGDDATLEITGRWSPHRSVASWYLWRIVDGDALTWV
ncbi:MAG: DNA-3-methyladenine glycosylase 2 family protein [Nevskia sp.]|nr:DNA-3-methyladenine glycosylase 2 family protein [Nevskia sp.]